MKKVKITVLKRKMEIPQRLTMKLFRKTRRHWRLQSLFQKGFYPTKQLNKADGTARKIQEKIPQKQRKKEHQTKLIVVSEMNGVELEEMIHKFLEKGIEEYGFWA